MKIEIPEPVYLKTIPAGSSLTGMSHWWGAPDLPKGVPYPYVCVKGTLPDGGEDVYEEPLTFLFQLRLDDIAHIRTGLPDKGMLYVFAPLDYHDEPVVIYSPSTCGLEPYEITWEGTDESIFRPAEKIIVGEGEDIVMLGSPFHEEIADAHRNQKCLLMLEENEEWGLRFMDCGTYYIFLEKDFCRRLEEAAGLGETVKLKAFGDLFYY